MNWWYLDEDTQFRQLVLSDYDNDRSYLDGIKKATPVAEKWTPLQAQYSTDELQKDLPLADFAMMYQRPVFNQRVLEALKPLISDCVETLPLLIENSTFYLINVMAVDCLDHERSEFTFFRSGNIKKILGYEFTPGCLDNRHIFRLPEKNYVPIYVSDVFKRTVGESGLIGFTFSAAFEYEGNLQEHSK